jgi:hypothetical protein
MKHAIGITGLILLSVFIGCSKTEDNTPAVICNNPDALNYQKNGTCTFPSDSIVGRYGVVITKYHPPCSTNDSGTNNTLIIEGGPCISHKLDSAYKVLIFYWVTPAFMPESFCVKLTDGFNFTIDSADNLLWYGAPVTGTGSFVNNKFAFTGVVQTYCGNYPLILEGEK